MKIHLYPDRNWRLAGLEPDGSEATLKVKVSTISGSVADTNHSHEISQHQIAQATSLSSAMVNSYIKELVAGGLIKIGNATTGTQLPVEGTVSVCQISSTWSGLRTPTPRTLNVCSPL